MQLSINLIIENLMGALMQIFASFLLAFGIVFGFFIPGALLNRALGRANSAGTSFVISLVILFQVIFVLGVLGISLNLFSVGMSILSVSALLYAYCAIHNLKISLEPVESEILISRKQLIWLIPVFLSFVLILLKTSFFYISRGDQDFRWFFLPARILELGTFDFYPPLTKEDYQIYFFTDSFPPMVSFSYFFLFMLFGKPEESLVFIPVFFQFIFIFCFGWKLAVRLFKQENAGLFAALLLSSTTLLFYSVAICQETGLTALSIIALMYFLHDKDLDFRTAIFAAFATSLGALSREYGGILLVCGLTTILVKKMPFKFLLQYLFFSSILIFPWYIRVFVLTGNPFYSNPFLGIFPVNSVHAGIIEGYKHSIGLGRYISPEIIMPFVYGLFSVAGLVVVTGLMSFLIKPKNYFIHLSCMYFIFLWLYSIWIPAGLFHSMRILSPAIAMFAVSGAGVFLWVSGKLKCGFFISCVLLTISSYAALLQDMIVPYSPALIGKFPLKVLIGAVNIESPHPRDEVVVYAEKLPVGSAILSDANRHHAFLYGNREIRGRIRILPIWSPEVRFLFEPDMSFEEANFRLRDLGINYVLIGDKDNLNMNYLSKFDFFRRYRDFSKPLIDGKILELPTPPKDF